MVTQKARTILGKRGRDGYFVIYMKWEVCYTKLNWGGIGIPVLEIRK